MAKYHMGDDGQPRKCEAEIKCPKGGEGDHIEGSLDGAREWAEERNTQEAGSTMPESHDKESINGTKKNSYDLEDEYRRENALFNDMLQDLREYELTGDNSRDQDLISRDSINRQGKIAESLKAELDESRQKRENIEKEYLSEKELLEDLEYDRHSYSLTGDNSQDQDLISQDSVEGQRKRVEALKSKYDDSQKERRHELFSHLEGKYHEIEGKNDRIPDGYIYGENTVLDEFPKESMPSRVASRKELEDERDAYYAMATEAQSFLSETNASDDSRGNSDAQRVAEGRSNMAERLVKRIDKKLKEREDESLVRAGITSDDVEVKSAVFEKNKEAVSKMLTEAVDFSDRGEREFANQLVDSLQKEQQKKEQEARENSSRKRAIVVAFSGDKTLKQEISKSRKDLKFLRARETQGYMAINAIQKAMKGENTAVPSRERAGGSSAFPARRKTDEELHSNVKRTVTRNSILG